MGVRQAPEQDGRQLLAGAGRVGAYVGELEGFEQSGAVPGRDRVGRRHTPPCDDRARTTSPVPDHPGMRMLDAGNSVIAALKAAASWVDSLTGRYTPLSPRRAVH